METELFADGSCGESVNHIEDDILSRWWRKQLCIGYADMSIHSFRSSRSDPGFYDPSDLFRAEFISVCRQEHEYA